MAPPYDEFKDTLSPLSRSLTVSENTNLQRAAEYASVRRKNSLRNPMRSQSVRQPPRPRDANNNMPSLSSGGAGGPSSSISRSQSVKQPTTNFAPSRSKSLRAPPPPRLQLHRQQLKDGKAGAGGVVSQDFPSPGRAPRGQRIFDPVTIAEDEGVDIAEPGWATDARTQGRLERNSHGHEHGHGEGSGHGHVQGHAQAHNGRGKDPAVEDDGTVRPFAERKGRMRSKSFKEILLRR